MSGPRTVELLPPEGTIARALDDDEALADLRLKLSADVVSGAASQDAPAAPTKNAPSDLQLASLVTARLACQSNRTAGEEAALRGMGVWLAELADDT